MKQYNLNKGYIIKKIEENITIFDAEQSLLYTLNKTGSYIFTKIKLGWNKDKIINALVKNYNIKKSNAQDDLNALINDLLTKKIVTHTKE